MPKFSIIIPAHNEEEYIQKRLREIKKVMDGSDIDHEIIVIDDGSTDDTYKKAKEVASNTGNIRVSNYEQGGKGLAIIRGFRESVGDLVMFLDADLDLHLRAILPFLKLMKEHNADVVVGSKRHPLSKINYPRMRWFLSWGYISLVKLLFKIPVNDTQTGMKLFKRGVLKDILPKILVKRYAFDLEVLINAHRMGYRIIDAPVEINYASESRICLKDIYHMALDTMAIFYRLNILKYYDKARATERC